MDFAVKGTVLPVLEATLQEGEVVVSTHGDLGWMTPNVQLSQTTAMGKSGGRGIMKAAKRVVGGGGLFITRYQAEGKSGQVVFAAKLPGNIINVEVGPDTPYYVHRSGFMCGTEGIEASVAMQQKKLIGGAFGGMDVRQPGNTRSKLIAAPTSTNNASKVHRSVVPGRARKPCQ